VRVTVLCVGGVKGKLARAIHEYEERAGHYWRFRVREVEAGLGKRTKIDPQEVRRSEGNRILSHLPEAGDVIALTRTGKAMGSRDLAGFLEDRAVRSVPEVTFVIGGAFGLAEEVLRRSALRLAISALTLPHEVARLVLAEQLYRAGTISRNEPYHKGP
jgi:23S rRNA (pseudouridine1915-N3)-methyltransferase